MLRVPNIPDVTVRKASERVVLRANETGTTGFKIVMRVPLKKENPDG